MKGVRQRVFGLPRQLSFPVNKEQKELTPCCLAQRQPFSADEQGTTLHSAVSVRDMSVEIIDAFPSDRPWRNQEGV